MTTPTIFSDLFADSNALYRAPKRMDGAPQNVRVVATIPAATATGTNVGLVPFNKGARVVMRASSVYVTDADTGAAATAALGWVYDDNTTYTNNTAGFAAASTAPQAGGIIAFDASTGYSFEAQAPGWVILLTGGETVEVAYTATADVVIAYN